MRLSLDSERPEGYAWDCDPDFIPPSKVKTAIATPSQERKKTMTNFDRIAMIIASSFICAVSAYMTLISLDMNEGALAALFCLGCIASGSIMALAHKNNRPSVNN